MKMLNKKESKPLFSRFDLAFAQFLQEQEPSDEPNHKVLASLVSHLYMNGHTCLDLNLLASGNWKALALEELAFKSLPKDLAQSAKTLPWAKEGGAQGSHTSPLVLDKELLYLRKNWEAEQRIIQSIRSRLSLICPEFSDLKEDLEQLFGSDEKHDQADWQKLACAVATQKLFTIITGGPGTGKTTTVAKLLALLITNARKQDASKEIRIALAAPTGKAAARLGASINAAVRKLPQHFQYEIKQKPVTLHKLLEINSLNAGKDIHHLSYDVIVIDEASMVSLSLMDSLLGGAALGTRLIFLGDQDQLASVEAGAVLGQLCLNAAKGNYSSDTLSALSALSTHDLSGWAGEGSALAQQTVMLRKSHRSEGGGVISQWAQMINAGGPKEIDALKKRWGELKVWTSIGQSNKVQLDLIDMMEQPDPDPIERLDIKKFNEIKTKEFLKNSWSHYLNLMEQARSNPPLDESQQHIRAKEILDAFGRFQILCAVREGPWGVNYINKVIPRLLGFAEEGWYAGRPVMVTRNDPHLDLRNGDVGICLEKDGKLRVAFPADSSHSEDAVRWILPSRLDSVESVFAMTVHKSQGSEFDQVCLIIPEERSAVLTKELIYTGLTRAKKKVTWIAPKESVLFEAIRTRLSRSGGLHALHSL